MNIEDGEHAGQSVMYQKAVVELLNGRIDRCLEEKIM